MSKLIEDSINSWLSEKRYILHDENENAEQLPVGKHNHVPDSEFDPEELKMGIEVELEHTDSREISKCIAKDHLARECKNYYTRLKKMESECKSKEEN